MVERAGASVTRAPALALRPPRSSCSPCPRSGALAAEPLYVLVDTAIVGHLGTTQLASLAIAATVMSTAFTIFNFLTYGTTAQVARLHGAGRDAAAAALGSQALWLGLGHRARPAGAARGHRAVAGHADGRQGRGP